MVSHDLRRHLSRHQGIQPWLAPMKHSWCPKVQPHRHHLVSPVLQLSRAPGSSQLPWWRLVAHGTPWHHHGTPNRTVTKPPLWRSAFVLARSWCVCEPRNWPFQLKIKQVFKSKSFRPSRAECSKLIKCVWFPKLWRWVWEVPMLSAFAF